MVASYSYGKYLSDDQFTEQLVGNKIIDTTDDTLTLSNGVRLRFDKNNSECCSYIDLSWLNGTDNIITSVQFDNTDDDEGDYTAWINVVAESGEITRIAEAEGNASNGYYLHGFALNVWIVEEGED